MERKLLMKILPVLIFSLGLVVLIGWFLDIPFLKSISLNWPSMKIPTALGFMLSGALFSLLSKMKKDGKNKCSVFSYILSLILILYMGGLFILTLGDINFTVTGHSISSNVIFSTIQREIINRPSVLTMVNFFLIGLCGVKLCRKKFSRGAHFTGWFISTTGVVAVLGYVFNLPTLYYQIDSIASAMAIHTGAFFIISGINLMILSKEK